MKRLQFGIMLHGEAQKGKWGLMADFVYLRLGDDLDTPIGGYLEAEVKESLLEGLVNYRFEKEWGFIDMFGGVRWWDIQTDFELEGILSGDAHRKEGWVDPVIGGRAYYLSSGGFLASFRADIGGFGVGSDFSWNIQTGIGYQFSEIFTVIAQYKYLDVDYNNGEEARELFALDAATHGPIIGFVLQF